MNIERIINAWRDDEYHANLDGEFLPESPIGAIDLSDTELEAVAGGEADSTVLACAIIASFAVVSAALCQSVIGGGSCTQGTSGCCPN